MSKKRLELLNDAQWELIEPLLPEPKRRKDNRGRPWASNRACFEGILWILQTGGGMAFSARQVSLSPDLLAAAEAVGRAGRWLDAWRALLGALDGEGLLKWEECFLDGSFAPAQKGGAAVGKTKRGKGTKWMVLVDGQGLPLGVRLESASTGEARLAEATLAEVRVPRRKGRPRQKPKRVIADRAYDSDPLRERLKKRGIDLIVPYRKNSRHRRYEDGRKLRRYKRRWIIERTNALVRSVPPVAGPP